SPWCAWAERTMRRPVRQEQPACIMQHLEPHDVNGAQLSPPSVDRWVPALSVPPRVPPYKGGGSDPGIGRVSPWMPRQRAGCHQEASRLADESAERGGRG